MSRTIKLTIEYDGTEFKGWQIQKKGERTIQGELANALKLLCKESISVIGSGRTDTGVHAAGQVAHFKTKSPMKLFELHKALNANLPDDIGIRDVSEVSEDFHAQYSVKSKTYRYQISNSSVRPVLGRTTTLFYPYKLNVTQMRQELETLVGKHDFKSFQASDPAKRKLNKTEDTVRTMFTAKLTEKGDIITIDLTASGFLYKMVRNIVGTLLEIGSGKLPKGSMAKILKEKNRKFAGMTAKPHGLQLLEVQYKKPF